MMKEEYYFYMINPAANCLNIYFQIFLLQMIFIALDYFLSVGQSLATHKSLIRNLEFKLEVLFHLLPSRQYRIGINFTQIVENT